MRIVLFALSLSVSGVVSAVPAPYYQWQSKLDGTVICRQTSPGEGWQRLNERAFRDLNCSMPAARVERPGAIPGFRAQPGR
ncbi:hypothetical protein [Pseudomonas sp.]|uniref:hypothetical protein n=1 Tax=Pseudomonas sp. TaxID=306 RepID=UPI003D0BF8F0